MKFLTLLLTQKRKGEREREKERERDNNQLLVTNFHKLSLWSDPDKNLKNKNWFEVLDLVIVYFK